MKLYYSNHISWQLLGSTVYIIDETTIRIYSLKDVAKDIWILIKDNKSIEEIVNQLSQRYNVSTEVLINDVNEFTDNLISEKLLTKGECLYA